MQESPAFLLPLVLLVSAGVLVLISRFSGWNLLSEHYPGSGPPACKVARLRRLPRLARLQRWHRGGLRFEGALPAGDADHPVLCHRRIFIPWSDITGIEEQRARWGRHVYAIRTRRAKEVDFALRPLTFAVVRDDARSAGVPGEY